jgi:hypothetical protein
MPSTRPAGRRRDHCRQRGAGRSVLAAARIDRTRRARARPGACSTTSRCRWSGCPISSTCAVPRCRGRLAGRRGGRVRPPWRWQRPLPRHRPARHRSGVEGPRRQGDQPPTSTTWSREWGGSISGRTRHRPAQARRTGSAFGDPVALAMMRQVKQALDPYQLAQSGQTGHPCARRRQRLKARLHFASAATWREFMATAPQTAQLPLFYNDLMPLNTSRSRHLARPRHRQGEVARQPARRSADGRGIPAGAALFPDHLLGWRQIRCRWR